MFKRHMKYNFEIKKSTMMVNVNIKPNSNASVSSY